MTTDPVIEKSLSRLLKAAARKHEEFEEAVFAVIQLLNTEGRTVDSADFDEWESDLHDKIIDAVFQLTFVPKADLRRILFRQRKKLLEAA